jgi:hypothetical protein
MEQTEIKPIHHDRRLFLCSSVAGGRTKEFHMTDPLFPIAERYVRLGLALEQHIPGYVDAYYGPAEWRADAEAAGQRPAAELAAEVAALAEDIEAATMDAQRKDYFVRQVRAMRASTAIVQGEQMTLADETDVLYDVRPTWTDEATFEEAHRALDVLLPAGASLAERMDEHTKRSEVPVERIRALIPDVFGELRRRTVARFGLPAEESVEFAFVQDQPWSAYNWYRGNRHSLIEINTDLPLQITHLVDFLAHEGYPGHHTEHALKETHLVRGAGRIENSIALINSPSCVLAEGIATQAADIVVSDEDWIRWHRDELFPRAGCEHLDAERERAIQHATDKLGGVSGNAAFLLHDQGVSPDEVAAYIQRWRLASPERAQRGVRFISSPTYRSYTFTYSEGAALLRALFEARGERDHWFGRLLREPATPDQIRCWTATA